MTDRVPSPRFPFVEPTGVTGTRPGGRREPPVALLAELAWECDWARLGDELRALTANDRSAVMRMAEDFAEEVEKSMQGDR